MRAIQDNDEAKIEEAILRLSESRRVFAPLAFAVGAFVMLFNGLRLLVTNWRLTLVQILPAMWIWMAMFDLKAHVLHGKSFTVVRGPILIPAGLLIVRDHDRELLPQRRVRLRGLATWPPRGPAGRRAGAGTSEDDHGLWRRRRRHACLFDHCRDPLGKPWFTISLGIVVGLMMVCYVAVPARLIGAKPPKQSKRDKLASTAVGGALSMTVCTPPYLLGRLGILALGSSAVLVFIVGLFARLAGSHPAGRRHRRRPGDQDERNPHRRASSQRGTGEHVLTVGPATAGVGLPRQGLKTPSHPYAERRAAEASVLSWRTASSVPLGPVSLAEVTPNLLDITIHVVNLRHDGPPPVSLLLVRSVMTPVLRRRIALSG